MAEFTDINLGLAIFGGGVLWEVGWKIKRRKAEGLGVEGKVRVRAEREKEGVGTVGS